jgi:hypothetical protein
MLISKEITSKNDKNITCLSRNIPAVPYTSSQNKVLLYFWPSLENKAIKTDEQK